MCTHAVTLHVCLWLWVVVWGCTVFNQYHDLKGRGYKQKKSKYFADSLHRMFGVGRELLGGSMQEEVIVEVK